MFWFFEASEQLFDSSHTNFPTLEPNWLRWLSTNWWTFKNIYSKWEIYSGDEIYVFDLIRVINFLFLLHLYLPFQIKHKLKPDRLVGLGDASGFICLTFLLSDKASLSYSIELKSHKFPSRSMWKFFLTLDGPFICHQNHIGVNYNI